MKATFGTIFKKFSVARRHAWGMVTTKLGSSDETRPNRRNPTDPTKLGRETLRNPTDHAKLGRGKLRNPTAPTKLGWRPSFVGAVGFRSFPRPSFA